MTTHKILVPINLSEESVYSIKQAIFLKEEKSEIHILLMIDKTKNYSFTDSSIIKEKSLRDLKHFVKKIFNNKIPSYIKLKVKIGKADTIIYKSHNKKSYNLLIINKAIRDQDNNRIFRTNTLKNLVNNIHCNIYTFKHKVNSKIEDKILIPIEVCKDHEALVREAIHISKSNNIGVLLIGILNSSINFKYSLIYEKTLKIKNILEAENICCEKIIYINTKKNIQEAVEQTIEKTNASVILVPSDNSWITNDPKISSLGKFLIYNSDISMYSVKSKGNCLVTDFLDSFKKTELQLDTDLIVKES